MAPFYQGYTGDSIHLHDDDTKGLQHLYGKKTMKSSLPIGVAPVQSHRTFDQSPPITWQPPAIPRDSPRQPIGQRPSHVDSPTTLIGHRMSAIDVPRTLIGQRLPLGGGGVDASRTPIGGRRMYAGADDGAQRRLADTIDICADPRLDAMTVIGNGSTYVFKGDLYWRLNQLSYEQGYPRRIVDDWDGLPGNLNAAVTDYDGDTYFFKGDIYWLFDPNGKRYKGYPRRISVGLVDTPNDIDAALIWNYDDKPYFFKDYRYWQYSRWGMPNSWPRPIADVFSGTKDAVVIGGADGGRSAASIDPSDRRRGGGVTNVQVPNHIDAAVKWTNGKSYVFSGDQYYRLTGWRVMKVVAGYPRSIAEWWFGCPAKSKRRRRSATDYSDK